MHFGDTSSEKKSKQECWSTKPILYSNQKNCSVRTTPHSLRSRLPFRQHCCICNHHHITRPHLHPFGPQGDSGRPAASIPWSFVDPISAFGIPYGWRLEMKNELYLTHVITDKTWSWDSEETRFHQRDTGFVLYINIIHILICWWYRRICLSFCVFLKLLDFITPNYSRVQKPKTNFGTQTCQDSYK